MKRALGLVLTLSVLPSAARAGEVSPRLWSRFFSGSRDGKPLRVAAFLDENPTPTRRRALQAAGARLVELPVGGLAQVGRVLSLDVPRDKLAQVASVPGVLRLAPAIPLWRRLSLDQTTVLAGAAQLRHAQPPNQPSLDGRGVIIADHEMAWDPLHPDLFYPDAGLFDWSDEDGSGHLSRGDTVVLDGRPRPVRFLEPQLIDPFDGTVSQSPPGFDPLRDWVYADDNGNGRRDSGQAYAGAPALGEPIWVADDVNANGRLEPGEKLVRLGTSKVRAIYERGRVFDRNSLTQYVPSDDSSHGLAVSSVLAGGWPELRRFTGMAPAAELVFIHADDPIEAVAAGDRLGATIHLWEFTSLVETHDGSSALEAAISESTRAGVLQVAATGNIGGSNHNMMVAPLNGETVVGLETTPQGASAPTVVVVILTWIGAADALQLRLEVPGRGAVDVGPQSNQRVMLPGRVPLDVDIVRETGFRGTGSLLMAFTLPNGGTINHEPIRLRLRPTDAVGLAELRGLVLDDASGWGVGASWTDHLTERGTALAPSTADEVLAVGAYGGLHDLTAIGFGGIGELRRYSGTGPRLDGARVVDLLGPDDPFAAGPDGSYVGFSGTSGALPHVVGAAALMMGAGIGVSDVVNALQQDALPMPGARPNPDTGWGKVSASAALGRGHPQPGGPPQIRVMVRPQPGGVRFDVGASGPAPIVRIEWDTDYDRRYDGFLLGNSGSIPVPVGADRVVVRAVDATGQSARLLLQVGQLACAPGLCRGADGVCRPCATDAGIRDAFLPDATRDAETSPPDAMAPPRDSGVPRPDATVEPEDAGVPASTRPPTLDTIPREQWGCGCSSVEGSASDLALVAGALLLGGWFQRRRASEFRVCRKAERRRIDRL